MNRAAVLLCVFLLSLPAYADFRTLLHLLPEISGYFASPAEGSSLRLPGGNVDTASRKYSSPSAELILSVYSGADIKALGEHGIKAGGVTRSEKGQGYNILYTGSGYKKGYIMLTADGSPLTVVLEYKGINPEQAAETVRSLSVGNFFKQN
ncbi:hypothetical protein EP073_02050 [Geovibrio thiophilus]|uniref:DUF4252 domain-containing protein n=1 Tax=Geovibrio thiophilus TaxID=139438 RepID=A0A3R5XWA7_9BACT|nr:hypothetical protein [Geovibrio thiophilus]QAR32220.1 hypothetical protein EP073_02050 [Geovibrio thiophilus]